MINWPYIIEDNSLSNEIFQFLKQIPTPEMHNGNPLKISKNKIDLCGNIISEVKNNSESVIWFLRTFYDQNFLKYKNCLNKLASRKTEYLDFLEVNLVWTKKDAAFPIHTDSPNKLLSVVIYIDPENNHGTFLYSDKNGKDMQEVQWKPNRSLIFSREENTTWHSYRSDGINTRFTLVCNLRSNKKEI